MPLSKYVLLRDLVCHSGGGDYRFSRFLFLLAVTAKEEALRMDDVRNREAATRRIARATEEVDVMIGMIC